MKMQFNCVFFFFIFFIHFFRFAFAFVFDFVFTLILFLLFLDVESNLNSHFPRFARENRIEVVTLGFYF